MSQQVIHVFPWSGDRTARIVSVGGSRFQFEEELRPGSDRWSPIICVSDEARTVRDRLLVALCKDIATMPEIEVP